ncbi:MAG: DUF4783 domain-containing protein [Chitinophagaceae bacterium]|nr:DUF4783 domain-containing protein [Chitinophagaceae bacterium]
MKKYLGLLSIILLLSSFRNFSGIDDVVAAMRSGNAYLLAKNFDNTVEIIMPDKSNSYSKNQAEVVLKDFFSTNTVQAFAIIHKGENAGSQYCIGNLITKTGVYRTTVYMKFKAGNSVVQEIRFEK